MKTDEAIQICHHWFAYLERQRVRSVEIQKLAILARTEPEEARKRLRRLDGSAVTVYDGGRLEPAVRHLVKIAGATQGKPSSETALHD